MDEGKKTDTMGWLRLAITIAAYVATVAIWGAKMDSEISAHIDNSELHRTQAELADVFVLRREYNSNIEALREDMRWLKSELVRISDKLDRLVERERNSK